MEQLFTTIAVFTYSSEAKIIKGRLESEGIEVFLSDELTIDTDPLVSNAIGGVKLKVFTENVEKANKILQSINQYSLSDSGEEIMCPKCTSTKIHFFSNITSVKSLVSFLFGGIFGLLPFYVKYDYQCEECKEKFILK
jgi:VIT1/CCC1 family predicted Fe2+/Mn2+ transporter